MDGFHEVTGSIHVPANTGVEGFLRTLHKVLMQAYVQSIEVNKAGLVTFRRFVPDSDVDPQIAVDFDTLQPYAIIRNARVMECALPSGIPSPTIIGLMFDRSAKDGLYPLAFASGAATTLWDWYEASTGYALTTKDRFFGLPFLTDHLIPDTALLLCAGPTRESLFSETRVSYKIEMEIQ
jgi:hypothetical protein